MTQNASFIRKIIYGGAIVALLFPLFLLGQPATKSESGRGSPGGKLAQMRADFGLSQAELGKIDPASETMKMATLGLRGFATNLLWTKANAYKMRESWDRLSATLNQIAKLQPNYITVWEFQAHNLSYNVSSEFDDYRHRYHWVKKGLDFLMEGTQYNQRNPRLFWNLGWFTGHKIGLSDESKQFRKLFREDEPFHDKMLYIDMSRAHGPDGYVDNWLVAHLWYLQSSAVVDTGVPITWLRMDPEKEGLTDKRRSSVIFYSDPSMALIGHAEAITGEMEPGEKTRNAWRRAGIEWEKFGNLDIPTTYGHTVRLNSLRQLQAEEQRMRAKLEELSPGLREKIREERRAALTPDQRAVWENRKNMVDLSPDAMAAFREAFARLTVTDLDVAAALPDQLRARAIYFAMRATEANGLADRTSSYAGIVNYDYWKTRCEVEQSKVTADARRFTMLADRAADGGDPEGARGYYEQAWNEWVQIFEKYPQLLDDVMAEDLKPAVFRYKLVLDQLDEEFPKDFKLKMLDEPPDNAVLPEGMPNESGSGAGSEAGQDAGSASPAGDAKSGQESPRP